MTPEQLAAYERALRKKWEAEQEIERLGASILGSANPAVPLPSAQGISNAAANLPLPRRVELFMKAARRATASQIIEHIGEGPTKATIRTVINRLIHRGILQNATDPDGETIPGQYKYVGGA
ncbi:MAG: BlaI/MecI/CopY family transcriptional regulator [Acidobacteria bacterium]|nr:BlaI/MecI/CopY family transcriptional regulator [Acidobacteriota bacterium]